MVSFGPMELSITQFSCGSSADRHRNRRRLEATVLAWWWTHTGRTPDAPPGRGRIHGWEIISQGYSSVTTQAAAASQADHTAETLDRAAVELVLGHGSTPGQRICQAASRVQRSRARRPSTRLWFRATWIRGGEHQPSGSNLISQRDGEECLHSRPVACHRNHRPRTYEPADCGQAHVLDLIMHRRVPLKADIAGVAAHPFADIRDVIAPSTTDQFILHLMQHSQARHSDTKPVRSDAVTGNDAQHPCRCSEHEPTAPARFYRSETPYFVRSIGP